MQVLKELIALACMEQLGLSSLEDLQGFMANKLGVKVSMKMLKTLVVEELEMEHRLVGDPSLSARDARTGERVLERRRKAFACEL